VLTVLYLVQGLPFGFLVGWLPLYLYHQGFTVAKITFVTLVNVPWLLKFLWAPLADRYFIARLGRRRSWILPSQGALVASLVAAALAAPSLDLLGIMALLTLVNLCAATQDIAVDGLAVDLLEDHERGVGNSVQAAAYKIGMIGGGAGMLALFSPRSPSGMVGCFTLMAVAVAVAMLVPIFLREPPAPAAVMEAREGRGGVTVGRILLSLFTRRGAVVFLCMVLLSKAGDSIANPLFRIYLLAAGLTEGQINLSMNIGGMLATLLGSAVCGFVIMRLGRRAAFVVTVAGQGLSHLGWVALGLFFLPVLRAPDALGLQAVWAVALLEHLVSGMLTVVVFTLMMDAVRPEAGSAQYTLLTCLYGGLGFGLGMVSGSIVAALGFPVAFGIAGLSTLGCLFLAGALGRHGYFSGKRPELTSTA
jgi:MFS family permease